MTRWLRRAWGGICDLVGILACLALTVLIAPALRVCIDISRRHEDG